MNFIVYDLEFNQDFSVRKGGRKKSGPKSCGPSLRPCFEVIQIGAIKLDQERNNTDRFNRLVKPTIYPEVSPFITELTGITTNQLSNEANFSEIYKDFIEFTSAEDPVLCVWGMADLKELYLNIEFHKLDRNLMPRKYINLQQYATLHFGMPKHRPVKLKTAAEQLKIPLLHPFHNAYYDAYYTAEIFKKLYSASIQPEIYDPDHRPVRQRPKIKKAVDFDMLISQFEKMYQRSMTKEEREMIILAYKMGKTQQFQKE